MGLPSNIRKLLKNITVEPAVFFYFLTYVLIEAIDTNLYLQKACKPNATTQPNLHTPCDDEKLGTLFVSSYNTKFRFIQLVSMIILLVFVLSWSDEAGMKRKICIILPILGMMAQSANGCLQSYYWHWSAYLAAVTDTLTQASSGGFLLMWYSSQLYLCDITTPNNRTMRIGILVALKYICMPVGNGISRYLLRTVGFLKSFLVCLTLASVSLVSTVVLVKDVNVDGDVPDHKRISMWDLFNVGRVIGSFKVVFKKRLGRKRIIVWLLLVVHVAVLFFEEGERSIFYTFMRHKFKWNEVMFGKYQTYRLAGIIVGTIFCSVILSKLCKLHDGIIGMFGSFLDIWAALGYVFANQLWQLYLIPLLSIFQGTAIVVNFSFLTRFYNSNELGRLNAVYNAFSLLISFSYPTYNTIFQQTIDIFPSAVFLVSFAINVVVCALYACAYTLNKKSESGSLTSSGFSTIQRHTYENQVINVLSIDENLPPNSRNLYPESCSAPNNDVIIESRVI